MRKSSDFNKTVYIELYASFSLNEISDDNVA